ncbi:VOC family protein [Chryseolinea sp. T2]|uniref:VOC family protein n=1 Tax=Chryseolinea sp. T2 TaxID=3129255 RepID=UPI003077FE3B
MEFPAAVPEIPVSDITRAITYYKNVLGFNVDWGGSEGGIAGISKGNCRIFLTDGPFRQQYKNGNPVLVWLNLDSKEEVNELYSSWKAKQANIISAPESKQWGLYEFTIADPDRNLFRVFYDFGTAEKTK